MVWLVFFLFLALSALLFLAVLALVLLTFLALVRLLLAVFLLPLLSGLVWLVLLAFCHFKLLFLGCALRADYREGLGDAKSGHPWFWLRGIPNIF